MNNAAKLFAQQPQPSARNPSEPLGTQEFTRKFGGNNFTSLIDNLQKGKNDSANDDEFGHGKIPKVNYRCSKWAVPFHNDYQHEVKAIMAGVGTGKSSAMCMEILRLGALQTPDANGVRYSRCAIIRATNNQLLRTTLKTWRTWVPDSICKIRLRPNISGHIRQTLPDGTIMDMEIEFMAVDDEKFLANLQGMELTFFWINEATELRNVEAVLKVALTRIKRYPSAHVARTRWSGGLLDYNPPRIKSFLYNLFEKPDVNQAKKFKLYKYPPAIIIIPDKDNPEDRTLARYLDNPDADFHKFQDFGYDYWRGLIENFANDENYVRRMVEGKYTLTVDGKPVFRKFNERHHVGKTTPDRTQKLLMGSDGGLFPAVVIGQVIQGQLQIHDEVMADDVTVQELLDEHLMPLLNTEYKDFRMQLAYDPGNNATSSMTKLTPTMLIADEDIEIIHVDNGRNELQPRLDAVSWFLNRTDAIKINPRCERLIEALHGDYHWNIPKGENQLNARSKPVKNRAADIADALQFLCLPIRNRQMSEGAYEGLWEQPAVNRRVDTLARNIHQTEHRFFYG